MGIASNLSGPPANLNSQNKIDNFVAQVQARSGLAPADRFELYCAPPSMPDGYSLSLMCESVTFPGRVLSTIDAPDRGYRNPIKIGGGYSNDDVTAVFHVTNDYFSHRAFSSWQEMITNAESYTANYPSSYTTDVIIRTVDQKNNPTYSCLLKNAYPLNVQSMQLDNNSTDTTVKVSVTFGYTDFINQ